MTNPLRQVDGMVTRDGDNQLFRGIVIEETTGVVLQRDGSNTSEGPYPKLDTVFVAAGDEVLVARVGTGYLVVGRISRDYVPATPASVLVAAASSLFPSAIVVGSTPGGELGGTWPSPTIDPTHTGSAHNSAIPEFIREMPTDDPTITAGVALTANQVLLYPIEPLTSDLTITTLVLYIANQSGNIDAGVYSYDGGTFTRIVSLGSTACPAAGRATLNIADTALTRGTRYFFAIVADNVVATFRWRSDGTLNPNVGWGKAASFPLPATITAAAGVGSGHPIIYGSVNGAQAI